MSSLTVIGMDGGPLSGAALLALRDARLVVGGARHLAAADLPAGCERVPLGRLDTGLERVHRALGERAGPVVVLASGDPGLFGIVRRLRAEGLDPAVLPGVSSVSGAFARLGYSWDGAAVVTAHGRGLVAAVNACRALPLVAVLTGPGAGAAELGAGLAGWRRRLAVLEDLGGPGERISRVDAEQAAAGAWREPHLVISMLDGAAPAPARSRADNQPAAAPSAGWALPEDAYVHRDSMITKAEVRALVVARLRPRLGRLVWDVGAGSGSVGVECAGLGAAVIAVDADEAACGLVGANAARHGVAHAVRVVHGDAPPVLDRLPDPDAAFVGGGGADVLAAVVARRPPRVVVALAALDRVAASVDLLRANGYLAEGVQLSASRLADLPGGSLRLAGTNPVVVLTGELG
jgi:precorrin-6B C5,15-methyltransferase / cobalt-precorrin-6B C5,C15-methyltransferase